MKEGEPNEIPRFQRGRLRAFSTILSRAHTTEENLAQGKDQNYVLRQPGKEDTTICALDQRFVDRMKGMAFDIYTSDFVGDTGLKAVADEIVDSMRSGQQCEHELEPDKEAWLKKLLGE